MAEAMLEAVIRVVSKTAYCARIWFKVAWILTVSKQELLYEC
jgi:hypothetical protein